MTSLIKIVPRPGIVSDVSRYSAMGGYIDGNLVRFSEGFPEPVGGWSYIPTAESDGVPRHMFAWSTLAGVEQIFVATNTKTYVDKNRTRFDITPYVKVFEETDAVVATEGLTKIEITTADPHGASVGDGVHVSCATVGGIPELDDTFIVTDIVSATKVKVDTGVSASSTETGGDSCVFSFELPVGRSVTVSSSGWGTGAWGAGGWGVSSSGGSLLENARVYSFAAYGQGLVFAPRYGQIFYWDAGEQNRAVLASDHDDASEVPAQVGYLMMSERDRHLVALGATDYGASNFDPMLIRWSDTEKYYDWSVSPTTAGGFLRPSHGNELICGVQTRQESVIFSDTALYSLRYIGGDLIFGMDLLSNAISIISPQAAISYRDTVFWMGRGSFYLYDGSVREILCPVSDKVFGELNQTQKIKIHCFSYADEDEITWYYCSGGVNEINSYVTYNVGQNIWYYGRIDRVAMIDARGARGPRGIDPSGRVWEHEVSSYIYDENGVHSLIPAYISSGPVEIGEGDQFMFVDKIIADVDFTGSSYDGPAVQMDFEVRANPGGPVLKSSSHIVSGAGADFFTEKLFPRLRGREISFTITSIDPLTHWHIGAFRLAVRPDGKK